MTILTTRWNGISPPILSSSVHCKVANRMIFLGFWVFLPSPMDCRLNAKNGPNGTRQAVWKDRLARKRARIHFHSAIWNGDDKGSRADKKKVIVCSETFTSDATTKGFSGSSTEIGHVNAV